MPLENTFRVAIFDEFLDAFARIPREQQKKVSKFMRKFRADPTQPSINYESISTFADPNLRTVRIDQAYRAVVLKPEKGNVFVLLWVDHHDKAMRWASNKQVVIHPDTGSLQVLSATAPSAGAAPDAGPPDAAMPSPAAGAPSEPSAPAEPMFQALSDADLASVGLPEALRPAVRAVRTSSDLDALSAQLPPEVYEALFFVADGEPLDVVRDALGLTASDPVDVHDFAAALHKPSNQRRFALITDDEVLDGMLDAPLAKWRVFLHPSQRRMVSAHFNGPARVLGGAGTGKTVVAMHRARHLATAVFPDPGDRILFTTFTHNLARDIQANLRGLCTPDVAQRIEVVHLDKWVADFLKRQGYRHRIVYWPASPLRELWDEALTRRPVGLPERFFREEWDGVIQPQGIATWEDYKAAGRAGRGVRLARAQRRAVWPVFEAYRTLLDARGLRESLDAMRDAANLLRARLGQSAYRAVVVDEAQDMSTTAFALLRQIIPERPNDLFIVGDGHQRIYRRRVVLSHAGVHIVGRSRKLYINYRTTDEIRRFAVSILQDAAVDDLDGGADSNARYTSLVHGRAPEVRAFETFREEVAHIAAFINQGDPARTCLVCRTHGLLDQYDAALEQLGITTYRLRRSQAEQADAPGLRVATMHRVKGLEFDRVILAGANDGVLPLATDELQSEDPAVREDAEQRERSLLYVALTRARREVLVTSFGGASMWLTRTPSS